MTNTTEKNHAISNAAAWLESIKGMVSDLNYDKHGGDEKYESALQTIQESPLSVEIRSSWYSPGADLSTIEPDEFNILLSTGGPALRIIGELDNYGQPSRCELQWQDWGTEWTDYPLGYRDGTRFDVELLDQETAALLTFCQQFYFGE